jgi:hypothetical protein
MHLFDQGWNKLRDTIVANQKRLGVIPIGLRLKKRSRRGVLFPPQPTHVRERPL